MELGDALIKLISARKKLKAFNHTFKNHSNLDELDLQF